MNKIVKTMIYGFVFLLMSTISILPDLMGFLSYYQMGGMTKSELMLYVFSSIFSIIFVLSLASFIFGTCIVLFLKLIRYLRKKETLGFFEKLWPYGLIFFILSLLVLVKKLDKHNLSNTSSSVFAANGSESHSEIRNNFQIEFLKYIMNAIPQKPDNFEEIIETFNNLVQGENLTVERLQNVLLYFKEVEEQYMKFSSKIDIFYKNISNIKWVENKFKEFSISNKEVQLIPGAIVSDFIEDFHKGIMRNEAGNDVNKISIKYILLIAEIGQEFCKLLLREQGHYISPNATDNGITWIFDNDESTREYDRIIDKMKKIREFETKINALQIKVEGYEKQFGIDLTN